MPDQADVQTQLEIGAKVDGKVKHIGIYGALVDIGTGQDALLHVSELGQTEAGTVEVGSDISAYIYKVRKDGHVALTMQKPPDVPWSTINVGNTYTGKVTRIENFGVFVDFGAERPGMVHVSEMADGYVKSPSDVVSMEQEVEVRVLKVNRRQRQIDLSMKQEVEDVAVVDDVEDEIPTSMAQAFRRAMEEREDDEPSQMDKKAVKRAKLAEQDDIIARTLRNQS